MTIRISETKQAGRTILKVDGRLRSEDVRELTRIFQSVQETAELDLSDLKWADRDGANILRELVSRGVEIHGASPYIELLLAQK